MLYTSTENKKIKEIKKLHTKKYRDDSGLFLVEGEHLVLEAYKSGSLVELILEENSSFSLDVTTNYVNNNVLKYISGLDNPSNLIGICKKKSGTVIGDRMIILDGIQDPGNLGTIIRSAVAFNVDTIILSDKCVDLYNNKCLRASQGMIFYTNTVIKDLTEEILKLKSDGFRIYGTKVTCGKSLKNVEKSKKFAIIMGNEGNGISLNVEMLCDEFIYIDMNEKCESLNVGVATSIILYELDK